MLAALLRSTLEPNSEYKDMYEGDWYPTVPTVIIDTFGSIDQP